jgi:Flp pilus assembly protein TadG
MRYYGLVRSALRLLRDFARDEDGGPLVEFTILMPMFFLVMFGIIEWGNIFYVQNNMLLAARQAVRQVAVGNVPAGDDTGQYLYDLACGQGGTPASPITGGAYTYTFTANVDNGCTQVYSASTGPIFGNVILTITTPASGVSIINYMGKIGGTLSAKVVMQEEFYCPGLGTAASASYSTSQKC